MENRTDRARLRAAIAEMMKAVTRSRSCPALEACFDGDAMCLWPSVYDRSLERVLTAIYSVQVTGDGSLSQCLAGAFEYVMQQLASFEMGDAAALSWSAVGEQGYGEVLVAAHRFKTSSQRVSTASLQLYGEVGCEWQACIARMYLQMVGVEE